LARWAAAEGLVEEKLRTAFCWFGANSNQCASYHPNNVKPDGAPSWAAVGLETDFDKARMAQLYGEPANYVARFNSRLDELVSQGWLLADDAPRMRAKAEAQSW
jgi:hypothetical protein